MTALKDRRVAQPGPVHSIRIDSFYGAMRDVEFELESSVSLLESVIRPLRRHGIKGAGVTVKGLRLEPARYVVPAASADPAYVAYYSESYVPTRPLDVEFANITVGEREGKPFVHCHAIWRDETEQLCGGHILPRDTRVGLSTRANAFGSRVINMVADFDPETNFTLFQPMKTGADDPDGRPKGAIARIRPNEDLIESIEAVCVRHGIREAVIRSGVGSIAGAEFTNGAKIDEIPTEMLVQDGRISTKSDGRLEVDLTISLIDTRGRVHTGKPVRGRNPVLICFELIIEARGMVREIA